MRLHRILSMRPAELRWRLAVAARTGVERLTARVRAPQWDRGALAGALDPATGGAMPRAALARRDWVGAHEALAAGLRSRPARFVLDPGSADALREVVLARWPAAAADAEARAGRILAGQYDLLGYRGLSFGAESGGIDWHFDPVHGRRAPRLFYADVPYLDPAIGDHKVIWEINRHQQWLQLGRAAWLGRDPRHAGAIVQQLEAWMAENPPLVGINWASMLELGFRALSWTWALHVLLALPDPQPRTPWLVDLLLGLHRQLTHLERNLSYYFSPNTHLTGEALALYVVGVALPELRASRRWKATGRRILLTETDRQIGADGGHAERSAHYQRYTLDFYLLALRTARLDGDAEAASRFADASARLARFTRAIADDTGRLPLVGDDDGGMLWPLTGRPCTDVRDSLAVAAAVLGTPEVAPWGPAEEVAWIAGPAAAAHAAAETPAPLADASRVLPETGYVVARDRTGSHALFDVGAHGYMNAGHAHADALSFTLTLANRPLLVDPGTSTYTVNPVVRDRMRSSTSHNTITVDGRSPSVPSGPFHWATRTDARLEAARLTPAFDWIEASHDGYHPLQHRRTLFRTADAGWLVVDELLGDRPRSASAHWHFDPAWTVAAEGDRLRASTEAGAAAWLLHTGRGHQLFRGDAQAGLGWHAPVYGTLLPAWTARVDFGGDASPTLLTWIGSGREWPSPRLERLEAACDVTSPVIAARVIDGDRSAVFMQRPGDAAPNAARGCRVLDYETDARVLHYVTEGERLVSISVIDGGYLETQRGWLSLEADDRITDLHVSFGDGVVDLRFAAPLPPLRLRVPPMFRALRLNGRELPLSTAAAAGILLVHGAGSRALSTDKGPTRPWPHSGVAFARH